MSSLQTFYDFPFHTLLNLSNLNINHLLAVEEALAHPYLARLHDVADEPICQVPFAFDFEQQHLGEEQMKDMIYAEAIALNPEFA